MNQERWRNAQIEDTFCGFQTEIIEREKSKEPFYKTLSAPITTQVEVTETCNLLCSHCYNFWR